MTKECQPRRDWAAGRLTSIDYGKPVYPKEVLLRMAFSEYKNNPLKHRDYWKKHFRILGREEGLNFFVPPLNIHEKKLQEWENWGLKPVPVPEEIRGPRGIEIISSMYRGKIEIWPVPEIKNKTVGSSWRLIEVNPVLNIEEIPEKKRSFIVDKGESIDLPTLIIGAGLIKDLTGHFPYEQNHSETWARVGGSQFTTTYQGPDEQKIKEVPGVFFSANGTLTIRRLRKDEQNPILIKPYQIPIKPGKIA